MSPLLQENSYNEYAYTHDLIDQAQLKQADAKYQICEEMVINSTKVVSQLE